MNEREAFLRRFHAARPGITSSVFAAHGSYARLAAAVPRGVRVLDVGCGDGTLVGCFEDAIGVDLAPSAGAGAAGRVRAARAPRLVAARAQALPFADGTFGAAVSHLAFMLFDDLDRVVGELRRVVVPGGRFAAMLGGGPTADGDDAFHRFLALAKPAGPALGDRRARSPAGWRQLFGRAADFERVVIDLSGALDDVWRFLGASYQLDPAEAPRVRAQLAADFPDRVPCCVVLWLATVTL